MKIYIVNRTENVISKANSESAFFDAAFFDLGNENPQIVTVDYDEARRVYERIELADAEIDRFGRYVIEAKDFTAYEIDDDYSRELLEDGYDLKYVAYEGSDLGGNFAVSRVYPNQFASNDDLRRYFERMWEGSGADATDDAIMELCSRVGLSDEWTDASYSVDEADRTRVFREALRRFCVDDLDNLDD